MVSWVACSIVVREETRVRVKWLSKLALHVGVTIGFEKDSVDVVESAGQAELCVAVLQPAAISSLPFNITASVNSMEVTAGEACVSAWQPRDTDKVRECHSSPRRCKRLHCHRWTADRLRRKHSSSLL